MKEQFDDRVIPGNGDIKWPPKLCDLTSLGNFLCLLEMSVSELKDEIIHVSGEIKPKLWYFNFQ